MKTTFRLRGLLSVALLSLSALGAALPVSADLLKPFVLGNPIPGDMTAVVKEVKSALGALGLEVVGAYSPYANATVICATNDELKAAAAKANNGGFGAAERVAVTDVDGKLQVSYVNPAYIGAAYGLGHLSKTQEALKGALGHVSEFGSVGVDENRLAPGEYHYAPFMPYFEEVDVLASYPDHKTAVDTVEKNLADNKVGASKVYRIDLANDVSVFGVGITQGNGADKKVMGFIDFQDPRSTAHLPYEMMVKGKDIIALPARFRIAIDFPDLKMIGAHGFTKIMSAPEGIKKTLTAVAKSQ